MLKNLSIGDTELDDLLVVINSSYGYDFRDYARASLQRRFAVFMAENGFDDPYDLKYQLVNDKHIFNSLLQRLTVNVTEMFRDPLFYRSLKEQVFPMLASYPIIKIWNAGCSSGEEVFSLAILLQEAGLLARTRIYATDINPHNIHKAKAGIFPVDLMKEYETNYKLSGGDGDFSSYYTAKYDHAVIRKDLRQNILFSQHNLVTDQVFNEFQLVCCRNVLIYFNKRLQNKVIQLFYDSLSSLGYLALGIKESLLFADVKNSFAVVSKNEKIFRRIR